VADNASSGLYVLSERRLPLTQVEPRDVVMTMSVDGEAVSEGTGTACLGDPLDALLWLARTARDYNDPLRAGQIVLSGALGPMAAVPPGAAVRAELSTLGAVEARFTGLEEK
jgi:2-keto-4-pentenoate hydratase